MLDSCLSGVCTGEDKMDVDRVLEELSRIEHHDLSHFGHILKV